MKRKRKTTVIERVEIVDEEYRRALIMSRLSDDGYRIIHIGPYRDAKTFPSVNVDWFMLTAERVVK